MVCTLLSAFLFGSGDLFAQSPAQVSLKDRAAGFKTFFDQHKTEKAYLHFDKPYYAAGDTIYFKAYVVSGETNALSQLSRVLYVDLIDPQNKITNSVKLQITDGLAWGDFAVPDSVPAGKYRVRAYTKLMLKYGNDVVFERTIPIAAIIENKQKITAKQTTPTRYTPDLQFFPEGGGLVTGVKSRVAFKAIMPDGKGIGVSGDIIDNENKVIAKFKSTHLGMGSFNLSPQPGVTYRAAVTYANGTQPTVDLPRSDPNGIAIAVTDSGEKISVHINPGKAFYQQNQGRQFGLFIYSGGKLTTVTDIMDGPDMRFDIGKKGLHSGITQITLLSAAGEPLCERLIFINKEDQLRLTLTADKYVSYRREKVRINIHAEDANGKPVSGHFSVSVVDNSKVIMDENKEENILTYMLLTSGLMGSIEEPGYYFNHPDSQRRADLDLVMLTHGYRRFSWKKINDSVSLAAIEPETGLSIDGLAKSFGGKPLDNGVITLIPSNGGAFTTTKTDTRGRFSFKELAFYDTTRFVLNAVNSKGGNNTQLTYTPPPVHPVDIKLYTAIDTSTNAALNNYVTNSKRRHEDFLKYRPAGIALREVRITGIKPTEYRTQSLAGAGNADQVLHMKDIPTGGSLESTLNGRLRGVVFPTTNMLIVIDGLQLKEGSGLPEIPVGDVETVEVLRYASAAIYGGRSGGGVLIITTKQGTGIQVVDIISKGVLPLKMIGYYKAREFYSPKYETKKVTNKSDLRSTIYWNAEIQTDADGNSSFEFYNSDGIGNYQAIVEGMENSGNCGVARITYKVEN